MKRIVLGAAGIIVLVVVLIALLGWIGLLEDTPLGPAWDNYVRGYGPARTPQEAADRFKKAIKAREYNTAAKYCTSAYAEQLRRGGKGAREMASRMDDLQYQMSKRGYNTDETKVLFFQLDPFPPDITITVTPKSDDEAWALFEFGGGLKLDFNKAFENWKLDARMVNVYWRGVRNPVRMVKEAGVWRFDFAADPLLQKAVERMNDEYKDYYNAYNVMSLEVKNEPTTKENAKGRLKSLIEEAAKD